MSPDSLDPQIEHLRSQAGVPEGAALIAMRRINTFGLQALRELDTLFRQFDELVTTEERASAGSGRLLRLEISERCDAG
jgi:hypothetical protein